MEKIIQLLKDNDGRMEAEKVCNLLGITMNEIPWGYNIGWARCLQVGGVYHLILSVTFIVVSFSIIVQGLTSKKAVDSLLETH